MSLKRILREKEERSQIQKEMNKRWNSALVSFSLNIPGKNKVNATAKILFEEGKEILKALPFPSLETKQIGLQLFVCFNREAEELKKELLQIEETHPLGRFFDFDVFDAKLNKLSRNTPRQCFLCSQNAFVCSRNQTHSLESLNRYLTKKVKTYFCKKFSDYAYQALIAEVDCTPKPGLVDKNNNGPHKDMNHALFVQSAKSLRPFFYECIDRGLHFKGKNPRTFFHTLRNLGKSAEKIMLQTTNGVNTHKGAIFSLGLHSAALGYLLGQGKIPNAKKLSQLIKMMCASPLKIELQKSSGLTAGEKIFKQFKIAGIREEASQGYPFTMFEALPYFQQTLKKENPNQAAVKTFLFLLSHTQDTNIIKRGGLEALKKAQTQAQNLLKAEHFTLEEVAHMDQEFIQKNLSPGGTADLLALIFFLEKCF